jgi:phosphoglycolate phosphatase-like HAD superfamily hydrolase
MEEALWECPGVIGGIPDAVDYFIESFGLSRFHHVSVFIDQHLTLAADVDHQLIKNTILTLYTKKLDERYHRAPPIDGVLAFLNRATAKLFVASGSEQKQLNTVLTKTNLNVYFERICGAPQTKDSIIREVLKGVNSEADVVFIGDSVADIQAAWRLGIDFMGLTGASLQKDDLQVKCEQLGFPYFETWQDVMRSP